MLLNFFGYLSTRRQSGYTYLAFLSFPMWLCSQQFSKKHSFTFPISSTFMFLTERNMLSVQGFRGLSANCQLVNLIGLSPWALFLNQLGHELAVTFLTKVGHLEIHDPKEIRHPKRKLLTSVIESCIIIFLNCCYIFNKKFSGYMH